MTGPPSPEQRIADLEVTVVDLLNLVGRLLVRLPEKSRYLRVPYEMEAVVCRAHRALACLHPQTPESPSLMTTA